MCTELVTLGITLPDSRFVEPDLSRVYAERAGLIVIAPHKHTQSVHLANPSHFSVILSLYPSGNTRIALSRAAAFENSCIGLNSGDGLWPSLVGQGYVP